jgi:23S rRNA (adenine2503-C2)-methyltransferase
MNASNRVDLKDLDSTEMEAWAVSLGLEAYRGRQIRRWLLPGMAASFEEMTNLPKALRSSLQEKSSIHPLRKLEELVSADGTRKYLFGLRDGNLIESVLIPEKDHFTICVSSQAGCAMGCRFCLTGKHGLQRNLRASEIIEQVIQVKRSLPDPDQLTNVVFMGMGEPLANYEAVRKAVGSLIGRDGMNFSHRKLTLSTCGLVPQMKRMGREMTVNLAVSLNAADNERRSFLMPVNREFPLEELIRACGRFPLPNRRMLTFEYILIEKLNNRRADALNLVELLRGLRAKINLIPFNPYSGSSLQAPSAESVLRFQQILLDSHLTAIIRKSKGRDIQAACGQLSGARRGENSV